MLRLLLWTVYPFLQSLMGGGTSIHINCILEHVIIYVGIGNCTYFQIPNTKFLLSSLLAAATEELWHIACYPRYIIKLNNKQ